MPACRRCRATAFIDFVPRGPNTLTDAGAFRAELARIRASGVALNDEELAYGLRSIASPICSQSGEAVAALNLAVQRTMLSAEDLIARFGPVLTRTARSISLGTGHRLGPR